MMGTPNKNAAQAFPPSKGMKNRRTPAWKAPGTRSGERPLGREWADWFEGLEFQPLEDGQMLLSGRIVDQAALIGVLTR